jgi:hypothetical protein
MNSPSVSTTMTPVINTTTVTELLALHDQRFVDCAYETLLDRAPDPEGLAYYLGRLRSGLPKVGVLKQLRRSEEGKAQASKLPGLAEAIRRDIRGRQPLVGWLFRLIDGTESNHPTERKLRAIENQLYSFVEESSRRLDRLEAMLVVTNPREKSGSVTLTLVPTTQEKRIKQLPPRAKDIYVQLKMAAAIQRKGSA